ncbi:unnamed protein product [Bursaphelenchus okinawaensis]|uniref:ABC transporter domain-containing protein n=1 Tax=Bursaphelenchus okinawaensis TaxID=465554 RepID=A0A811LAA9_9BILA|nr:unnamed protein product [Bursaphelenchus okinawaensis]CAG9119481.1 unnamed protein product [Bursaphelenchus okinawaensis]
MISLLIFVFLISLLLLIPKLGLNNKVLARYLDKWNQFDSEFTRRKLKLLCWEAWPNDPNVRLKLILRFFLMVANRFVNFLIPFLGKQMVDELTGKNDNLYRNVLSMSFGYLCMQGGGYVNQFISSVEQAVDTSIDDYKRLTLESKIFNRIIHLPYSYYISKNPDAIETALTCCPNVIIRFPDYFIFSLLPILVDLSTVFFLFSGSIDITFVGMMLGVVLLEMGLTKMLDNIFLNFYDAINYDDSYHNRSMYVGVLEEFETIKYYCNEEVELNNYIGKIKSEQKRNNQSSRISRCQNFIRTIINDSIMILGSFLMAYQKTITNSGLSTGDYIMFSHYLNKFQEPLYTVYGIHKTIKGFFEDIQPLYNLMEAPTELPTGNTIDVEITGGIKVENVSYWYDKDSKVLDNVSFEVPEGQTLALVGPSGSGKSTLIRLLYKLLDPKTGCIKINDTDIRDVNVYKYRREFSIVPQECVLLNTTVKHNIHYGKLSASDEEIEKACKVARIQKLFKREENEKRKAKEEEERAKKEGYNYYGPNGEEEYNYLQMSGGEKQRVGIARAVLKGPKYLLMDEATSSLDSLTERQIQIALMDMAKDKTCVIVAHRLSTIAHADKIIVLKEGKIVEDGNHTSLLEKGGLYAQMWKLQLGGELDMEQWD